MWSAYMKAVRLIELNKKIGLRGNYKAHTSHGVILFISFATVYVLRGLLTRANDFLWSEKQAELRTSSKTPKASSMRGKIFKLVLKKVMAMQTSPRVVPAAWRRISPAWALRSERAQNSRRRITAQAATQETVIQRNFRVRVISSRWKHCYLLSSIARLQYVRPTVKARADKKCAQHRT